MQEGELLGADMEQALVGDGEIDWDCPCLQGMAHGPCGESFKTAFSCFVTSSADPKGADCVEHFVAMRDCMIAHPADYPDLAGESESDSESDAAAAAADATNAAPTGEESAKDAESTPTTAA